MIDVYRHMVTARELDRREAELVSNGEAFFHVSGAGHDAQMLARVCPTAMVFVPSRQGLSHNVREHTDPAQLVHGANVLLQVLLQQANR